MALGLALLAWSGASALAQGAGPVATAGAASLGQTATRVAVRFEGLRSAKGLVRACLTRNPAYFPHCDRDPAAFKGSIAAGAGAHMAFDGVPPGDYALTVLHDENGNAKVDTMFGIPREGVGFSRNPAIRFGPPSFSAARIHVGGAQVSEDIKLKYFL